MKRLSALFTVLALAVGLLVLPARAAGDPPQVHQLESGTSIASQHCFASNTTQAPSTGHEVLAKLPQSLPKPARPTTLEQAEGRVDSAGVFAPDWVLAQSKESVFQAIATQTDSLIAGKNGDREKAKAIYDWVSQNITYDYTASDYWMMRDRGEYLTDEQDFRVKQAGDAFYVFAQKRAICGGYSNLCWLMACIAQVPVAAISGDSRGEKIPHAWNAVLLDGKWLFFDATWSEWDMAPNYHSTSDGIAFCDGVFQQNIAWDPADPNYTSYWLCPGFECPANVVMPEGCFDVMSESFKDCTTLKSIVLPSSLTSIESFAFQGCTGLTSITIPAGVKYVQHDAFRGCSNLKTITFLGGNTEVREDAFYGTAWLNGQGDFAIASGILIKYNGSQREVTIPSGVTAIANSAFVVNLSVTKVVIPEGVTSIGEEAFRQCRELTNVTIPKSVKTVGYNAFAYTPWLEKQGDFPAVNGILLDYQGNTDIQSLVVPDGVREISDGAFSSLQDVRSITIPASVTKIGKDILGSSYLEEIHFGGTREQWEKVEILQGGTNWKLRDPDGEGATVYYSAVAPGKMIASPSIQKVNVDGKIVEFAMYSPDGGRTNYIRVRDLAAILNGTAAQFEVGWNGNVALTSKTPYSGSADKAPFSADMPYTVYEKPTYVDGKSVDLDGLQILYNGGGFTYYKLRDLAEALGFNVGWSGERGIYVETNKPYDPAN